MRVVVNLNLKLANALCMWFDFPAHLYRAADTAARAGVPPPLARPGRRLQPAENKAGGTEKKSCSYKG